MKASKTPAKLAKNASKLHKKIGELLTSCDKLRGYEIRQEYRVSAVNPTFTSNREKFDWVILGLRVVIEVHGQQHYTPVCFGGIPIEEAIAKHIDTKRRDDNKEDAARMAGWAYVVVKYDEYDITEEELYNRIRDSLTEVILTKSAKEINKIIKHVSKEKKVKIKNQGFQKKKGKYQWPTKKIQNRSFKG